MSCNNWERGTIKLPSAVYAKFRRDFIIAFCLRENEDFARCVKVVDAFRKGEKAPQEGQLLRAAVHEALNQEFSTPALSRSLSVRNERYLEPVVSVWRIARDVTHDKAAEDPTRPSWNQPEPTPRKTVRALTKTLYPLSNTKTRSFMMGEATVDFNDEQRSVSWDVRDNNHAVERARESFLGQTLFAMLEKVQWTRGSGGEIVGNDEYNRDDSHAGGGANYVTDSFGPNRTKTRQTRGARAFF